VNTRGGYREQALTHGDARRQRVEIGITVARAIGHINQRTEEKRIDESKPGDCIGGKPQQ
jgi:hypothetical protein